MSKKEILGISFENEETYNKVQQFIKGKEARPILVLFSRLLAEGHITEDEFRVLIDDDFHGDGRESKLLLELQNSLQAKKQKTSYFDLI